MHRRSGSATLSQLAFPRESNPNFPCEKSKWDNTVVKTEKKEKEDPENKKQTNQKQQKMKRKKKRRTSRRVDTTQRKTWKLCGTYACRFDHQGQEEFIKVFSEALTGTII